MSSKKKVSAKKSSPSKKELRSSLSTVRGQLTKTEAKLDKAKARAKRSQKEASAQRRSAQRAGARVTMLQQKLDLATAAVQPTPAAKPAKTATSRRAGAQPVKVDTVTVPDKSWTVVQLRAEARARGLVGMSNKPKAELLRALS